MIKNIISKSRQSGKTELTKIMMLSLYGNIQKFEKWNISVAWEYMNKREEILNKNGWTVECSSPFEIRHDDGSFATGQAANLIFRSIVEENSSESNVVDRLIEHGFPEGHKLRGDNASGLQFIGLADMLYDTFVHVQGVNVDSLETLAKLAKIRCLQKAPKNEPQINWYDGVEDDEKISGN